MKCQRGGGGEARAFHVPSVFFFHFLSFSFLSLTFEYIFGYHRRRANFTIMVPYLIYNIDFFFSDKTVERARGMKNIFDRNYARSTSGYIFISKTVRIHILYYLSIDRHSNNLHHVVVIIIVIIYYFVRCICLNFQRRAAIFIIDRVAPSI